MKKISKSLLGTLVAVGVLGASFSAYAATNSSTTNSFGHMHHGPGSWGGPRGMDLMSTVAKELNLSTSTLQSDLKAGKTIASLAQTQGVTTTALIADLETAAKTNLAQAVSSGKLTSAQEQKMLTNMNQQITNFVNGTMPKPQGAGGMKRSGGFGRWGNMMATVAKDLNISTTTLQSDIKAGKTIASIAQAQGVSTSALISDLETSAKTNLDSAVSSGKMTTAQETQALSRMDQMITDFVNGVRPNMPSNGGPNGAPPTQPTTTA